MEELDINQNVEIVKSTSCKEVGSVMSQHEALRRATLIKHRKVSTQLKLDMVQRQLSHLHRSTTSPDSDRQFYREQMRELSSELEDLGSSQDRAEQIAFRARSRLLRQCGLDGQQSLAASNPNLSRSGSGSRGSLKHRVCHLVSSSPRFRKSRHLFGELRAVASLSSLSVKATSPTGSEEDSPKTDQPQRSWRSPLRFLGHLVATRRKLWSSTKRTKSADNILEEERQLPQRRRLSSSKDESSSESSSRSEEESEEEEEVWRREERTPPRYATRAPPVVRKISAGQMRAQVDPALLAEIEDFERMAAQYIKQHS